jgi:hypothetical protein
MKTPRLAISNPAPAPLRSLGSMIFFGLVLIASSDPYADPVLWLKPSARQLQPLVLADRRQLRAIQAHLGRAAITSTVCARICS